jgi:hypothetical protein
MYRMLLLALLVVGCGPLAPPMTDGGSGGGSGSATGGSGGGGGGVTGGGSATGGGATGGGGTTGGGAPDTLPNYVSVQGTPGGWALADRIPQGQRPYNYNAIRGRSSTELWVAGPFGDVWFFDGATGWTLVQDDVVGDLVYEDLAITSTGLVAVSGPERLLTCPANCNLANSFSGGPITGKRFRKLCVRDTRLFAVGVNVSTSKGVLYEYTNAVWSEVPLPSSITALESCHVLGDGRVLLGGASLWVGTPGMTWSLEPLTPAFGLAPLVWTRMVEAEGRVFAMGTFGRIAQRRANGTWKPIYEPSSAGAGFFDAWPLGNGDVLFVGDQPNPRVLLSGTTFTRLPDPVDFLAHGVWASDATHHWLAGERAIGVNRAAFVLEASQ